MTIPATMRHATFEQPGPPEVIVVGTGAVPRPEAGRGADRGRLRRRQPAGLPAARRRVPAAGGRLADPGARSRGTGGRAGRRRDRVARRRHRLRADARRRLRRVLHRPGGLVPARSGGADGGAGGGAARERVHRVEQPVRPRPPGRRRDRPDPRRHQRHRPDRDPAREALRRHRHHDGRQRGKGRVLPRDRRRPRDRLPDAGLRRRGRADHGQARRRRRARHGRRQLHREEPEVPGARGAAGDDRVPAGRARRGRLAADHDEAPHRHRLDAARVAVRAQGRAGALARATRCGRSTPAAR